MAVHQFASLTHGVEPHTPTLQPDSQVWQSMGQHLRHVNMGIGHKQLSKRLRTASTTQVVRSDSGLRKQEGLGVVNHRVPLQEL